MQDTSDRWKITAASNERDVCHRLTVEFPMWRTNLAPTPTFTDGSGNWFASGQLSTEQLLFGTQSLKIIWTEQITEDHSTLPAFDSTFLQPGGTYTVSGYVYVPTGSPAVVLYANTVDDEGNGVDLGRSPASTVHNGWQRLSLTFSLADVPRVAYGVAVETEGAWEGLPCYTDGWLLEAGDQLLNWFSGDSEHGEWTGRPGESVSRLNVTPYRDLTLALEGANVDRSVTTDVPAASRLIAGYPAASCNLTLSGLIDPADETKTAAWLFDPWNSESPLHGIDLTGSTVVLETGFDYDDGPELLPVFTGEWDDCTVDHTTGVVTIACVDYRNKLRSAPILPAVAAQMDVPELSPQGLCTCYPGLHAEWVIDTLLRANGVNLGPPPRQDCSFYASFCGSAYPQLFRPWGYPVQANPSGVYGWDAGERTDQPMAFVPGHFYPTTCRDVEIRAGLYPTNDSPTIGFDEGDGWFIELWCDFGYAAAALADPTSQGTVNGPQIAIEATDGSALLVHEHGLWIMPDITGYATLDEWLANPMWSFQLADGTFGQSFHADTWTQISVQVTLDYSANYPSKIAERKVVWINGVQTLDWTEDVTRAETFGLIADTVYFTCGLPVECLQVTPELDGLPSRFTAQTARFDPSLNNLAATPALQSVPDPNSVDPTSTADPWQIWQQLADAELAVAGFDERGQVSFTNRQTIGQAPVVRALTTRESIKTIQSRSATASVTTWLRQNISVVSRSDYKAVWSAGDSAGDDVMYLDPGQSYQLNVTFEQPVVGLSTAIASPLPNSAPNKTNPFSGYRANTKIDGSGTVINNLTIWIWQTSPTTAQLILSNPNPFRVYLVTPSGYTDQEQGAPCLKIGGEFLTISSEANTRSDSTSAAAHTFVEAVWPPLQPDTFGVVPTPPTGTRFQQLPDTPWMQDVATGQSLVTDELADTYRTRPLFQGVAVVADPSLQLLDKVQLQDQDGNRMDEPGLIVGIHLTLSKTDCSQSLDLRATTSPRSWVMGVPGRSEMGVTTYV
jgi:hypothetical protein